ncbi:MULTISPECIES: Crp/Fnr family transcriptional regulator [Pacificimonas]|uniref:Crp/Fnr family transcriptional regulator n=1 Tax=Pacificimonas aurantium TaxID=1250540 RepID=A0ABS7WKD6_9SPHN|nr:MULTISPECIES: Crp/Fnr family transcriptional regulator [Pacificimonas]MBZ6378445.1 Crp/Fnr family transcriptional regulator [Pacificimonas aurantium]
MPTYPPSPFNWIDRLPARERAAVKASLWPIRSREGGDVYSPSATARGIYRLLAGSAKMYLLSQGGGEILLKRFSAGESFGEVATLDREDYPVFVSLEPETLLGYLSLADIQRLMTEYPAVTRAVQTAVSTYGRAALGFFYSAVTGNAVTRIRDRLEWIAGHEAAVGAPGVIRITQAELASMVGLSRQTVNEALAALAGRGEIRVGNGSIMLTERFAADPS